MITFSKKRPNRISQSGLLSPIFKRNLAEEILYGFFYGATQNFWAVVATRLGAPAWSIAVLTAMPYVGMVTTLYWAQQMDGREKKPFVYIPWLLGRCILINIALISNPYILILIVGIFFLSEAVALPAYASLMSQFYSDRVRGRAMGILRTGMSAAMVIAALITGKMLETVGYKIVFPGAAVIGVLAGFVFWSIPFQENSKTQSSRPTLKELLDQAFSVPGFRVYCWSTSLFGFGNLLPQAIYPIFWVHELKLSDFQVGILLAIYSACMVFSHPIWGWLIDKIGPFKVTFYNVMVLLVVPIIYYFANNFYALFPAFIAQGISFAGFSLAYPNNVIRFDAGRGDVNRFMAVHSTLLGLRGSIAPLVGTFLMSFIGMKGVILIAILMEIGGGISLAPLALKKEKQP